MKKIIAALLLVAMALCFAACTDKEAVSVDMTQVYSSYEEYLPEMVMLDETSMMNLYGVDIANCNQAIVATCGDGLRSDEIWLIEAVDEESANEIAKLAQNRVEREGEETKNYAPDQYAVVEKAQIIENGTNVVLIISPEVDTLVELYNSAANQ